jgi:DNA modification methylase
MTKGILDHYHIRDARQLLSVLPPSETIDTTITSPPYWNLKNYGSKNQVGFGQKYEEYLDDLSGIFSGVYRVTKSTGSLWIVVDTIKHNGELM